MTGFKGHGVIGHIGEKPIRLHKSVYAFVEAHASVGRIYQIRGILPVGVDYEAYRNDFYWEMKRICMSEEVNYKMEKCRNARIVDLFCDNLDWLLTAKLSDGILWNSITEIYKFMEEE